MLITLPRQFEAKDLFPFVNKYLGELEALPDEVQFDFSNLSFVRPSGIVFLSNLSRYLDKCGVGVSFDGMDPSKNSIRFLDDSLFFEQHVGHKLNPSASPRGTTMPLQSVMTGEAHGWIGYELVPWLSVCSGLPQDEFAEFRTCISELFNNISDHTDSGVGSIFCQWYPNEKRLMLALADIGVGIPEKVRSVLPELTDEAALLKSFEDGFSTKSLPTNRGVGLHFLKQNVVERLGGSITVRSRSGAVTFEKVGNNPIFRAYNQAGYCPGTFFELEIRTDQFDFEPEGSGEIQWI